MPGDETTRDDLLPRAFGPPHDPRAWLLDGQVGWRIGRLDRVEAQPGTGLLRLVQRPGSGRSFSEPSGSLGGLVLPRTVALGPTGDVYLLDPHAGTIKRFDPFACRFDVVPCLGGVGPAPRQVRDPAAIEIRAGNLFVCDPGNHRLSVFALHGFVLRGWWTPPPGVGLGRPWEPVAIAFNGQGTVYVADRANGCIHRFRPSGSWIDYLPGFGAPLQVAVDCRDRLHVLVSVNPSLVRVLDTDLREIDTVERVDEMTGRFAPVAVNVDANGNLHLAERCSDRPPARAGFQTVFDPLGQPVQVTVGMNVPSYESEGMFASEALDSRLNKCQWHRVVLRGELPPGTSVEILTYTSEAAQSLDFVLGLPDADWASGHSARVLEQGAWDGLIRSAPGRFLWLRLRLLGSGATTPALEGVVVEYPRISLRRHLPAIFGMDSVSADFLDRFLAIFDTTLRGIEAVLDGQARFFDPRSTPSESTVDARMDFLTWLGTWIGVTVDPRLPEDRRRALVGNAARLYHLRGTLEGLRQLLILYLGMVPVDRCCPDDKQRSRCTPRPDNCVPPEAAACTWEVPPMILEHYQLRRWLFVGGGRLGDQTELWGKRIVNRSQLGNGAQADGTQLITTQDPLRDPFHVYAHRFSVFVPACYTRENRRRKALETLLQAERPAHTLSQLVPVEPRFRIGVQSMIGLDSVVGRYPDEVTLGDAALGDASVLGKSPYAQGGPSFEVGRKARVGLTTELD